MGGDQKQSLADTARKAIDEYFDFKAEEIKSELRISGTKTVNYLGLYDFVFTPLGKDWSSQGFPWGVSDVLHFLVKNGIDYAPLGPGHYRIRLKVED